MLVCDGSGGMGLSALLTRRVDVETSSSPPVLHLHARVSSAWQSPRQAAPENETEL